MRWFLYNILFTIGFILLLPRFLYRMCRRGGYAKGFMQRLGWYGHDLAEQLRAKPRVWIHAVSVGEVFVALRLIEEMRSRDEPFAFILSTTTSTGHAIALKRIHPDDALIYFPVDFPLVIRHVLNRIRPRALLLVECELWPNLIRACRNREAPVFLVNGRLSERSFSGYRKVGWFTRALLPDVTACYMQGDKDAERIIKLGALPSNVKAMGTAKYDVAARDSSGEAGANKVLESMRICSGTPILLGGSTWAGEEEVLLDIYRALKSDYPDLLLILAPRHVERTPGVVRMIEDRGLAFVRRSVVGSVPAERVPDVFLMDTTGELSSYYPLATVIFVGKSLTQHGGQNVIEPALYAKPIMVGPNMENFPMVMEDFLASDAILQVRDAQELQDSVLYLLSDSDARIAYGQRAAAVVERKRGVVGKTVDLILDTLNK